MAKITDPYACDVCGTKKQATNKWFLARAEIDLNIWKWSDESADMAGISHICGLDCLAKWTIKEAAKMNGITTDGPTT